MRILILIVTLLLAFPINAQQGLPVINEEEKPKKNFFKEFYNCVVL